MDETILKNIEKMLIYRSQLRECPLPQRKPPTSFLTWDAIQNKFLETNILQMDKFTTKHYSALKSDKNYIILTEKSVHHELKRNLFRNRNVEVFPTSFFKINKLDFIPRHTLYSNQDLPYKKKLPKLLMSDAAVLFCKFNPGEVIMVDNHLRIVIEN